MHWTVRELGCRLGSTAGVEENSSRFGGLAVQEFPTTQTIAVVSKRFPGRSDVIRLRRIECLRMKILAIRSIRLSHGYFERIVLTLEWVQTNNLSPTLDW